MSQDGAGLDRNVLLTVDSGTFVDLFEISVDMIMALFLNACLST